MSGHEGHRKRLRQTYLEQGADALHDHQALELLLTFALPRVDTNPLAHTLLETFGSLRRVLEADVQDLMRVPGVGESAAVLLSLAGSLPRRQAIREIHRIAAPADAIAYCRALFLGQRYEAMYGIALDKNMRVLHCDRLSSGTLNETAIYPRLVVESALRCGAYSMLLTHNHPSGDPHPSRADIDTTMLVLQALEPIGIKLHDHLIIAAGGAAFSMTHDAILARGTLEEPVAMAAEREP